LIRFECSCGKRLKVRAADIGHTVECPDCAAQLVVPDPDALPVAEEAASAPDALAAAMRELAPTAVRPSKIPTKKTPPAAPGRSPRKPGAQPAQIVSAAHKPVIIGVAAVLALAVLLLILSFFAGSDNKPATKEGPPAIQAPPPPTTTPKPERNLHPPGDLFPKVAPTN
jgi:hypothetical protein